MNVYCNAPIFEGASIPCHGGVMRALREWGAMGALIECYLHMIAKPVKQVVVVAMVILSNNRRVWTMTVCLFGYRKEEVRIGMRPVLLLCIVCVCRGGGGGGGGGGGEVALPQS